MNKKQIEKHLLESEEPLYYFYRRPHPVEIYTTEWLPVRVVRYLPQKRKWLVNSEFDGEFVVGSGRLSQHQVEWVFEGLESEATSQKKAC